jgi:hypothetical protein
VEALYDSAIVVLTHGPRIETKRQWRIVADRLRRIRRLRMKDPRTKLLVKQRTWRWQRRPTRNRAKYYVPPSRTRYLPPYGWWE